MGKALEACQLWRTLQCLMETAAGGTGGRQQPDTVPAGGRWGEPLQTWSSPLEAGFIDEPSQNPAAALTDSDFQQEPSRTPSAASPLRHRSCFAGAPRGCSSTDTLHEAAVKPVLQVAAQAQLGSFGRASAADATDTVQEAIEKPAQLRLSSFRNTEAAWQLGGAARRLLLGLGRGKEGGATGAEQLEEAGASLEECVAPVRKLLVLDRCVLAGFLATQGGVVVAAITQGPLGICLSVRPCSPYSTPVGPPPLAAHLFACLSVQSCCCPGMTLRIQSELPSRGVRLCICLPVQSVCLSSPVLPLLTHRLLPCKLI